MAYGMEQRLEAHRFSHELILHVHVSRGHVRKPDLDNECFGRASAGKRRASAVRKSFCWESFYCQEELLLGLLRAIMCNYVQCMCRRSGLTGGVYERSVGSTYFLGNASAA